MLPIVGAKVIDKTMYKYDSYMKDGVNITLMGINKDNNKFLICVNNEENIVTIDGISKQYFTIKVEDINKDNVELSIDIDRNCKTENCKCEGYCYNKRCFQNEKYIPHVENESINQDELAEEWGVGIYVAIIFIILFIAIIGVAYYVIKKKI